MEYLFCYMPPTPNRIGKIKGNQTQPTLVTKQVFCSTATPSKSFYIIFVDKKSMQF